MSDIINAFLQIVLLSSVMITIVILVKSLFAKRVSPSIMAVLWIMILLRLTLPITIESPIQISSTILPTKSILTDNVISNKQDATTNINDKPNLVNNTIDTYNEEPIKDTNNIPSTAKNNDTQISKQDNIINELKGILLYELIFILWCVGAVFMLLKATAVTMGFNRKLKKCRAVENPFVLHMVTKQKNELAIKKTIRIVECDHVDIPMVFGYFKPYLLIPKKYLTKNKDNLYYILLHEMCHIARHDILKNYLWLFAKVIHWFNPLVHIAYKMYQDNIELCCDQMVVNRLSKDDKYRYSQTLVDVIRMSSRKCPLPAASLCTSKSVLKERVLMMIQPRKRSKTALMISMVLALVMVLGGFTTACMPKAMDVSNDMSASNNVVLSKKLIQKIRKDDFIHNNFAPPTWKEEIESENINIQIDANIYMEKFPYRVYEITPQDIQQEHIDNIISCLIGNEKIYYKDIDKTKAEVEKEIDGFNNRLENLRRKDEKLKAIYNEQIELRENALKETEDDKVRFQFDINVDNLGFIEIDVLDEFVDSNRPFEEIYSIINNIGEVDLGKATTATLELDKKSGTFRFENSGAKNLIIKKNLALTKKKYIISLNKKYSKHYDDFKVSMGYHLSSPGVGMFDLSAYDGETLISDDCHAYATTYDRTDPYIDMFLVENKTYESNYEKWIEENNKNTVWPNILIHMVSDESGVLVAENIAQNTKSECISKGVEFVEFDEIKEIFKKNVLEYGNYILPDNISNNLIVDEIAIGYMYVEGGEYEGQVLMIPVWRIYGELKSDIDKDEYNELNKYKKYGHSYRVSSGCEPIMTINAIDGTIVER